MPDMSNYLYVGGIISFWSNFFIFLGSPLFDVKVHQEKNNQELVLI